MRGRKHPGGGGGGIEEQLKTSNNREKTSFMSGGGAHVPDAIPGLSDILLYLQSGEINGASGGRSPQDSERLGGNHRQHLLTKGTEDRGRKGAVILGKTL